MGKETEIEVKKKKKNVVDPVPVDSTPWGPRRVDVDLS